MAHKYYIFLGSRSYMDTFSEGFLQDAKDDEDPLADLGETEDLTEPTEPN